MPHDHQNSPKLVAVSITLPSWRAQPGDLGEFDVGEIRKELIEAMETTDKTDNTANTCRQFLATRNQAIDDLNRRAACARTMLHGLHTKTRTLS